MFTLLSFTISQKINGVKISLLMSGMDLRGRDHMVLGFTTTCAIGAYHHWCCEFESQSGRCLQHYVIKFVSDLRQVSGFLLVLQFPPPIKLIATIYNWNIVEIGIKHHKTKPINVKEHIWWRKGYCSLHLSKQNHRNLFVLYRLLEGTILLQKSKFYIIFCRYLWNFIV